MFLSALFSFVFLYFGCFFVGVYCVRLCVCMLKYLKSAYFAYSFALCWIFFCFGYALLSC